MASGPYHFEFFRCIHCGQKISVYDTEPCCNPKAARAKKEGLAMQKLSPTTKSLVRLVKRAKAHGINPWHIIRSEHGARQATILFNTRHIRVRDDGSLIPEINQHWTPDGVRMSDPHWEDALYTRMYECDIAHVAYCRRMKFYGPALKSLEMARNLRTAKR